ncbi:polysaccharide pyruvyl transferase family protein [Agathobacter sp. LCP21S3_B2]|uniref:polysaccharide pyruvyl transferase family protein n=1 Tax=Agathobacter sp. LCP21S3_B2 TaxID=3438734 RepID=UPI003F8DCCBA
MKIEVITMHGVQNYGSALQALATKKLLENHGCEVVFIDYVQRHLLPENIVSTWSKGNPIKALAIYPTAIKWKKVFNDFCKDNLNLTPQKYSSLDDFNGYNSDADAYCTGSDQVWNSIWNRCIDYPLYLSFIPKEKYKFALSASFGLEKLDENEIKLTKPYIDQYKHISVREKSGLNILEEQYHYKNGIQLCDPTISLSGDAWRNYSSKRKIDGDYILIYNLNRSKEFDNYAKKLSKVTGLKLVRFCTRYDQFYRCGKSILVPEVFDFISLIDGAKYVLTDSFHATAFSMNLNTEPICVYPKDFGGRIEDFLKLVKSEHRHIADYSDFDVINRPVNFNAVNDILSNERKRINEYIDTVLEEVERYNENSM